ncbi:MAG: hypothetical protein QW818_03275 [Candidatus Aenigmatarchaeota archaeon]|nr:hypothetical protein [Candidatus Aenigmarchaeota archaeon]
MDKKISETISTALRIVSWGLIIFAILMLLLKWLKIIGSPAFEDIVFT